MKQYAIPECAPISRQQGSREVCLALHGFCAAPATFVPWLEQLLAPGWDLRIPLLPGHGTRPEDMLPIAARDILDATVETYESLAASYDTVHLLGLSMGGALASYLAGHYGSTGKVGKLLLLAPAFALKDAKLQNMDYSQVGDERIPLTRQPVDDPALACSNFVYDFMYVKSIGHLVELGRYGQGGLESIASPTWLVYGCQDPVVDNQVTLTLSHRIPHLRRCQGLENSGHNVLNGPERQLTLDILREFQNA